MCARTSPEAAAHPAVAHDVPAQSYWRVTRNDLLLAAVVGSGIIGARLNSGNVALALLANTPAPGDTGVTLILTFGAVSGAHSNPVVTLAKASQGGMRSSDVPAHTKRAVSHGR